MSAGGALRAPAEGPGQNKVVHGPGAGYVEQALDLRLLLLGRFGLPEAGDVAVLAQIHGDAELFGPVVGLPGSTSAPHVPCVGEHDHRELESLGLVDRQQLNPPPAALGAFKLLEALVPAQVAAQELQEAHQRLAATVRRFCQAQQVLVELQVGVVPGIRKDQVAIAKAIP